MDNLRDILASNLRNNRRKLGISQPKLAELANLSHHYVSMIELSKKFPTPEVLEKLAKALGIPSHELFSVPSSPENAVNKLHNDVLISIKQAVNDAVKEAIDDQFKGNRIVVNKKKK